MKEVELSNTLENTLETMSLKKPNEVYKVLYENAKNKAKLAKKALIIAYLEAKARLDGEYTSEIVRQIQEYATGIDYAFDTLQLGGGKRNSKKRKTFGSKRRNP